MRLTEYFYYLETGKYSEFTHLSLVPEMQRQRKHLAKQDKEDAKIVKKIPQTDLFEEN